MILIRDCDPFLVGGFLFVCACILGPEKYIADHHIVISIGGVITIRIYVEPDDQMLKEINQKAKESGIGKAQFVKEAVDQFLHGSDQSELASTKANLDKAREDLDKRYSEITTLRAEIATIKADLEKTRSAYEKVLITNQELQQSADQARSELEGMKRDHDHFKSTLEQKDKQISFLEGHVSQLTQSISQLALPPSQEEAKKKGWWQFWK
jgi:chromosome segregation ATPase